MVEALKAKSVDSDTLPSVADPGSIAEFNSNPEAALSVRGVGWPDAIVALSPNPFDAVPITTNVPYYGK